VTSDIAASLGMQDVRGVIVNSVEQGSPAERAGLKQGDVVLKFNGADINDGNSLRNMVASAGPGAEANLTVLREGREQQLRAILDELSTDIASAGAPRGGGNSSASGRFGMSVAPLTPRLATQLGLRSNVEGMVVTDIDPAGVAADAGMQPGDVIEQVDRQPTRSVEELDAALDRARDRPALLLINRRGASAYLTLRQNR
jgi:S1-C subfamily serine protease